MAIDPYNPTDGDMVDFEDAPDDVTQALATRPEDIGLASHLSEIMAARGRLGGRPSAYEPAMDEKAFKLLSDPLNFYPLRTVAVFLGVPHSTFQTWLTDGKHDSFSTAVKDGLAIQEGNALRMLVQPRKGISTTGLIFALKNSAHRYRDKIEQETKVSLHTELQEKMKKAKVVDWDNPELEPEVAGKLAHSIPEGHDSPEDREIEHERVYEEQEEETSPEDSYGAEV